MNRRLCVDDEPAHKYRKRDKQILKPGIYNLRAEYIPKRLKADIDAGHKQDKSDISKDNAYQDIDKRFFLYMQGNDLKNQKESYYRKKSQSDFAHICGKFSQILPTKSYRMRKRIDRECGFFRSAAVNKTENQDGQNWTYRAKRDQTETVVFCLFIASCGSDADTESHYERNRHGSCRDPARIKRNRKKFFVGKCRKSK